MRSLPTREVALLSARRTKIPMTTLLQDIPQFELQPYKSLSNEELSERIEKVRRQLGSRLMILGHHYQQDEVIAHAD